jgi:hypothetical protein
MKKTMISSTKSRCKRVRLAFQDPVTLMYLNFVAVLASYVTPFLFMLQSSQPLVHVLYQRANELVRQCMQLFMKPGVIAEKEGHDSTEVDCESMYQDQVPGGQPWKLRRHHTSIIYHTIFVVKYAGKLYQV